MNKYHFKKALITLSLTGTMILVGCSNNKNMKTPSPKPTIEKEIDDSNITPNTPKPTDSVQDEREYLLNEKMYIDPLIEQILKSIIKGSSKDASLIHNIYCEYDFGNMDYNFIYTVIDTVTKKSKKENSYKLKKLKFFNNLDRKQKKFQKQILLVEHCSTYGNYKFYRKIGSYFETNPYLVLVTNQQDEVLLAIDTKGRKIKNTRLQDFSKLLKAYDIKPQKKYTYKKLCKDITFRLNKKINDNKNNNLKKVPVKDVVVIDTKEVEITENTNKRYYFLEYRYPYLFASKTNVYSDIFNPNANAIIDQNDTLEYIDYHQKINMFNSVIINANFNDKNLSFQSLDEFLNKNNITHKKYISYERLAKINKKVNKRNKKVKIKDKTNIKR